MNYIKSENIRLKKCISMERPPCCVKGKLEYLCGGGRNERKSLSGHLRRVAHLQTKCNFPLEALQVRFRLLLAWQKPSGEAERVRETVQSGRRTVQLTAQTCTGSSSAGCAAGGFSWPLTGASAAASTQKVHTATKISRRSAQRRRYSVAESEANQNLTQHFPPSAPSTGVFALLQEARLLRSAEEAVKRVNKN